ncbi:hypothetical protein G210_5233, partial [Candida maltosa Xu316]
MPPQPNVSSSLSAALASAHQVMSLGNHAQHYKKVTPLEGSNNYHSWVYEFKRAATTHGFFNFLLHGVPGMLGLDGDISTSADTIYTDGDLVLQSALETQLSTYFSAIFEVVLSDSVHDLVFALNPIETWSKLERLYGQVSPETAIERLKSLYNESGASFKSMIHATLDVFDHYPGPGTAALLHLSSFSSTTIAKVSTHYMNDTSHPDFTVMYVAEILMKLHLSLDTSSSKPLPAFPSSSAPSYGQSAAAFAATLTCRYCHMKGHILENCQRLAFKNRKARDAQTNSGSNPQGKSGSAPTTSGPTSLVFLAREVPNTSLIGSPDVAPSSSPTPFIDTVMVAQEDQVRAEPVFFVKDTTPSKCFIIDSGSSAHISSDIYLFDILDRSYSSNIQVASGGLTPVTGKGDVTIVSSSKNTLKLKDALFVPGATANLFSVSQAITNSNVFFLFSDKGVHLVPADSIDLSHFSQIGLLNNGIYSFNYSTSPSSTSAFSAQSVSSTTSSASSTTVDSTTVNPTPTSSDSSFPRH